LATEPVLLTLSGSFVVVGDIHGSIDDLLQIFSTFDYPPARSYIFLGDYVDRGNNSIEVLLSLYSLKALFPNYIYLLRGNHECEALTRSYGFRSECLTFFRKKRTYHRFCESFAHMPIAARVNNKAFCVHGGISPNIYWVSDLNVQIQKPVTDPSTSLAEHLLWSDPANMANTFVRSPRKLGFLFNGEAAEQFLAENGLTLMIRAHEYCESGSNWTFDGCLTVFSASDYCGRGNAAAVVLLDEDCSVHIEQMHRNDRGEDGRTFLPPPWLIDRHVAIKPEVANPSDFLAIRIDDIQSAVLCG